MLPVQPGRRSGARRRATAAAALTLATLLAACGKETTSVSAVGSVVIAPAHDSLRVGDSVVVQAKAVDANGEPLTGQADWTQSSPATVRLAPIGAASLGITALAPGLDTIVAAVDGLHAHAVVTVFDVGILFRDLSAALSGSRPLASGVMRALGRQAVAAVRITVDAAPALDASLAPLATGETQFTAPMPGLPLGTHAIGVAAVRTGGDTTAATIPFAFDWHRALDVFVTLKLQHTNVTGRVPGDSAETRADFAFTLIRLLGQDTLSRQYVDSACFPDAPGSFASGEICQLQIDSTMLGGSFRQADGGFHPDSAITVAELARRIEALTGTTPAGAPTSRDYVQALIDAGWMPPGVDTTALLQSPDQGATHYLAAAILYQTWVLADAGGGQTLAQRYIDPSWRRW